MLYVKGDDLDKFIEACRMVFECKDYVVIRLEPGDRTRYDLSFIRTSDGVLTSYFQGNYCELFHNATNPIAIKIDNKYTKCVIADVFNMLHGYEPRYYDWEKSCPSGTQ